MQGKEIKKMVQNKLLTENEDLFFVLVHRLNGIIMLSQLYRLLNGRTKTNQNLIKAMENNDLIKTRFFGKNKVVLVRHKVYDYLNLYGKVSNYTGMRLQQSTLFAEIYLSKQYDIARLKKEIMVGNQSFHNPDASLNLLVRINKGRDLLTLRAEGIFISDVRWRNNKIFLDISILPYNSKSKKCIDIIAIAYQSFTKLLYPQEINIHITVYSHNKADINRKNYILRIPSKNKEFIGLNNISEIICFNDFNSQHSLFGNINPQNIV